MKSPVELYFTNGQNTRVKQPLLLEPGETQSLVNADLSGFGSVMGAKSFHVLKTFDSIVNTIFSEPYGNRYIAEGANLWANVGDFYTAFYTTLDGTRLAYVHYNGWMYFATKGGMRRKFLISTRGSSGGDSGYWGVDNPTVAATTGGYPYDVYVCYYSWVAKYADNSEYETELSPPSYTPHTSMGSGTATGGNSTMLIDSSRTGGTGGSGGSGTATGGTNQSLIDGGADFSAMGVTSGMTVSIVSAETGIWYSGIADSVSPNTIHFLYILPFAYTVVAGDTYYIPEATGTGNPDSSAGFIALGVVAGMSVVITSLATGQTYSADIEAVTATSLVFAASLDFDYVVVAGDPYVLSGKTEWSDIGVCSIYEVTHVRLYRSISGDIKQVAELKNGTTTYTDKKSDTELLASSTFANTGYYPPPQNIWLALEYYRRIIFVCSGEYSNCIFWSEPEQPQAVIWDSDTGLYANFTNVFRKNEEITGVMAYGGDLFICSKIGWARLVGSSPDYWSVRPTLSNVGNLAKYAMQLTKYGILHVWWDGVYLFNGYNSTRISGRNLSFFKGINWSAADSISSSFDGNVFRLLVPYGTSTTPNRAFTIDMETYPKIKCYEEDQGETLAFFDNNSDTVFYGKGAEYGTRTGSGAVSFDLWTKAVPTSSLLLLDGAYQLNYEIETGGEDLTVTLYLDGVAHPTTLTLNKATRARDVISLPKASARTISLRLTGQVSSKTILYEPWILLGTSAGGGGMGK